MKVLGLITEYNPFHNGHLYHLKESIKATEATHTIAVMSGNFLQRGEPALLHKWNRAKMAVEAGVDLVLELPTVYACSSAEWFSYGAVSTLHHLGIVDSICFGSEEGSIKDLQRIAEVLVKSPPIFKEYLKKHLSAGISYPNARGRAIADYFKNEDSIKEDSYDKIISLIETPNNILSIEYLKALIHLDSPIKPYTILRIKAPYHSTNIESNIVSATAIREHLKNTRDMEAISHTVPASTYKIMKESFNEGIGPLFSSDYQNSIITLLRRESEKSIGKIYDVVEGLENRIKSCGNSCNTLEELYGCIKTKRYTYTRLQRIMMHLLLGINKRHYRFFYKHGGPKYIRVLAFNEKGRELLRKVKTHSSLPIITKLSQGVGLPKTAKEMLDIDIRATNIYSLGIKNQEYSTKQLDYHISPIYVK